MAHRNIKITRNIVQTCNKLCTFSKSGLSSVSSHKTTTDFPEFPNQNVKTTNYHCSVSTAFNNEAKSCWGFINSEADILEKLNRTIEGPSVFSGCLRKNDIFNLCNVERELISSRRSLPLVNVTRCYAKRKDDKCKYPNPKCVKNHACPKFLLKECPVAVDPPDCQRKYREPNCTKKMAPYPSYSELCAYRLEDDPSECHQCPWTRCGGVEDIKPQKKGYHTSTRPIKIVTMIPSRSFTSTPVFFIEKQCDATKEQCKEPPPKCKKKEKESKCPKKEKCNEKEKKKLCMDQSILNEAWIISGSMRNLDLQRYYFGKQKIDHMIDNLDEPSSMIPEIAYEFKDDPRNKTKCPKKPNKYPDVDHTIDPIMEAKEHDKGHPPPCKDQPKPASDECPADINKKKKTRQQKDLYESYYRRNPPPYQSEEPNNDQS